MKTEIVIVINPGSTSTKFALWERSHQVIEKTVHHDAGELVPNVIDQLDYRRGLLDEQLLPLVEDYSVAGVVGRGGLLKPLKGGTYIVNELMLDDLKSGKSGFHASGLGAILADYYARKYNVKAYIVDPVTVDEFHELSRLSGVPWISRKSRSHALNIKAVSRRAAAKLDIHFANSRFVVAHLGGGTSIAAVEGGRIIDVNDALLGMGPYSPERAGALPIGPLIEKCFSGQVDRETLVDELSRNSGLKAYTGTSDVRELLNRVNSGDREAKLAIEGMIYQDAKEIGAMAAVLKGKLNAVILTGGLANSQELMAMLKPYVSFLGPFVVFPGEGELQALAAGAFRVIDNEETAFDYE